MSRRQLTRASTINRSSGIAARLLSFSIPLNPLMAVDAIMMPPITASTGTLSGIYWDQICPKKPSCVANQPTEVKQITAENTYVPTRPTEKRTRDMAARPVLEPMYTVQIIITISTRSPIDRAINASRKLRLEPKAVPVARSPTTTFQHSQTKNILIHPYRLFCGTGV